MENAGVTQKVSGVPTRPLRSDVEITPEQDESWLGRIVEDVGQIRDDSMHRGVRVLAQRAVSRHDDEFQALGQLHDAGSDGTRTRQKRTEDVIRGLRSAPIGRSGHGQRPDRKVAQYRRAPSITVDTHSGPYSITCSPYAGLI